MVDEVEIDANVHPALLHHTTLLPGAEDAGERLANFANGRVGAHGVKRGGHGIGARQGGGLFKARERPGDGARVAARAQPREPIALARGGGRKVSKK